MNKKLCLILAMLMLFALMTGCQTASKPADAPAKVEETAAPTEEPTPEPEPEPTANVIALQEITPQETEAVDCPNCRDNEPVDPNAAHKNTDEEIEAIAVEYCEKHFKDGYDPEKHKAAFTYASMPDKADWKKINKNLKSMYEIYPYNMYVPDLGNAPSQFKTNKELVEEIGEKKVRYYGDKASSFADFIGSNYKKHMNREALEKQFSECGLPADKVHQYTEQKLAYYNAYNFEREAWVGYDELLVYRDAAGFIRARMEYNLILREADDNYMVRNGVTTEDIDRWMGTEIEVKVITDAEGNILDYEMIPLGDMIVRGKQGQKNLTALLNS